MTTRTIQAAACRFALGWGLLGFSMASSWVAHGQSRPEEVDAMPSGRESAPVEQDLTGYWVSVVTENWHLRMTVPPPGEYAAFPLNERGRQLANSWDAAHDLSLDDECKGYGAAGIMRVPGRLHIFWADDDTLLLDFDSGLQTRRLHFDTAARASTALSRQGLSVASWESTEGASASGNGARYLTVTTTRMDPGYLQKNGVPYSDRAILKEYFHILAEPNGDAWLVVTSVLEDPAYLARPYIATYHFRRLTDDSSWDPTPCSVSLPR